MKKVFVLSFLFASFAYPMLGQVYKPVQVLDELSYSSFKGINQDYSSEKSKATYNYRGSNNQGNFIYLNNSNNNRLFVSASSGLLVSIESERMGSTGANSIVNVYGRNEAFDKNIAASDVANVSEVIGTLDFSDNTKHSLTINEGSYRYFYLAQKSGEPAIKSLTVTWQLAHFRDNLTIGKVGTICLPYDVCADDLSDEITAYSIAGKVMDAQEDKVETVVFEAVDKLEAGIPYLFVSKKTDVCLKYSYEESKAGEYPITQAGNKNGLYGSFENHEFTTDECKDNDLFLISNNQINLAGAGAGVGANRAYIKMSEVPPYVEAGSARKLLLTANGFEEVDGVTTIVPKVATYGNVHTSSTYDLQGRRSFNSIGAGIILQDGRKKFVDGK